MVSEHAPPAYLSGCCKILTATGSPLPIPSRTENDIVITSLRLPIGDSGFKRRTSQTYQAACP